ncbi:MAG: class I SAM-dependent methyltransferase [Chloroflexi bacterium]|nr:class I SAM-dependent methyltransferase [Chloroflexota bacterium]
MSDSETKGHRCFAAVYDLLNRWGERKVLGHLRPHIAGEATGRVLEIGAGTGANFPYYRMAETIVATDPDPFMLERAQKRAGERCLAITFVQCAAEELPFPDCSFDTVVATLVLCTVRDPARALAAVRRVLKPDGAFRFIEHVRADGGLMARVQDFLTPAWSCLGAGCHLNRRTAASLEAAGFEMAEIQELQLPLLPLISGIARPRAQSARLAA